MTNTAAGASARSTTKHLDLDCTRTDPGGTRIAGGSKTSRQRMLPPVWSLSRLTSRDVVGERDPGAVASGQSSWNEPAVAVQHRRRREPAHNQLALQRCVMAAGERAECMPSGRPNACVSMCCHLGRSGVLERAGGEAT